MEVRETLWKRCLSTPIKPPAKNSNIWLSETTCQHKETRKKCKKTNQAAIIQWQRQCLMDKPHRKPWRKSKMGDICKHSPSPLHHTFLLGRVRFTPPNLYPPWFQQFVSPLREINGLYWSRIDLLGFYCRHLRSGLRNAGKMVEKEPQRSEE